MVFWGVLFCIVDITISQSSGGYGFRFDLVNDLIGTVLIAIGVFRLTPIEAGAAYATVMASFVRPASIAAIVEAALSHFVVPADHGFAVLLGLAKFAIVGAAVVFCFAMRWLSEAHGLGQSVASWRTTCWLMIWFHMVPAGLLQLFGLLVILRGGGPVRIQSFPLALILIVLLTVPVLHLMLSLWRMRSDIEARRFLPYSLR